jgi:hypothetical protein
MRPTRSVPARARFSRDGQKRLAVPDAGIDRGERRNREAKAGPDSPGFGKRQRKVSEPELSLNSHELFLSAPALLVVI